MTDLNACPICGDARPANRTGAEPWCCSLACYRSFHGIGQPEAPSCQDSVTMTYPTSPSAGDDRAETAALDLRPAPRPSSDRRR